ncbi:unnamed protein product [Ectocarpus sp. CCAP 1310/34]|nr:unnamed protein product [Ectocarpus sp. CCAP 1310/34]
MSTEGSTTMTGRHHRPSSSNRSRSNSSNGSSHAADAGVTTVLIVTGKGGV